MATPTAAITSFPRHRLRRVMKDALKTPLCLVSCGSFSPITYLHLRMFEMAADYVKFNTDFEIVGGYLSPVSDAYKKAGLASAEHRIRMCELATEQTSNWLMVDAWEARQKTYQPTAVVLDRFERALNEGPEGGVLITSTTPPPPPTTATKEPQQQQQQPTTATTGEPQQPGYRKRIRVALLAGADLIQTMSMPGVWSDADLTHILGRYGSFIVERAGTDVDDALASLQRWKQNIYVIPQLIHNDVSSTKLRLFLRRGMSVAYLTPAEVIRYVEDKGLYRDTRDEQQQQQGQGRGQGSGGVLEEEVKEEAGKGEERGKSAVDRQEGGAL